MDASRVAVVVLNWNGCRDTLECLSSLQRLTHPARLIVVDSGSEDGSVAAIRRDFPDVELCETGVNLGYAGGNNAGIRVALKRAPEFILLLNNDTIVAPDLVTVLLDAAARVPQAAFFAPRIYYHALPTTVWYGGAEWDPNTLELSHTSNGVDEAALAGEDVREVAYACGCALFVRARVIDSVGLMDERFFLTYEEADWCYRARRAGYPSVYVPQAKVWHKVSASFGGAASPLVSYYMTRNRLLWARKNLAWWQFFHTCKASCRGLFRHSGISFHLPPRSNSGVARLKQYYWATAKYVRDARAFLATPTVRAQLAALRDFALCRFGNRNSTVARLEHDVQPLASAAAYFTNLGFESPDLSGGYKYSPAGATWSFGRGGGIAGNSNEFTHANPPAPEGVQVAFLQNGGSAYQTASLAAGHYIITFMAAQRATNRGSQVIRVKMDGVVVGEFQPPGTDYTLYQTSPFNVAANGVHTLTLLGAGHGLDFAAFIDDVRVTASPGA